MKVIKTADKLHSKILNKNYTLSFFYINQKEQQYPCISRYYFYYKSYIIMIVNSRIILKQVCILNI